MKKKHYSSITNSPSFFFFATLLEALTICIQVFACPFLYVWTKATDLLSGGCVCACTIRFFLISWSPLIIRGNFMPGVFPCWDWELDTVSSMPSWLAVLRGALTANPSFNPRQAWVHTLKKEKLVGGQWRLGHWKI